MVTGSTRKIDDQPRSVPTWLSEQSGDYCSDGNCG